MDIIYARGQATAAEVEEALADAPSYSTVRTLLSSRRGRRRMRKRMRRFAAAWETMPPMVLRTVGAEAVISRAALGAMPEIRMGMRGFRDIYALFEQEDREPYSGTRQVSHVEEIRLEDVHFAYPGRAPLLEGVSLSIPRGGRVVLFGSHPEFGIAPAMDDPWPAARMLLNAVDWQLGERGAVTAPRPSLTRPCASVATTR